ncbi:amino acid deaminase [Pseudoduganella sp. LjRoot289]|uniref:amino acid deaminase n=1 Tax=Pseudoduganella sp. LjRoot289 TaxID=3342314 RepID=UPI003ED003E4
MDRHLPDGGLALACLAEHMLQPGVKGLPLTEPMRQGAIPLQRWNVLRGDTSYPVALLKETALLHNLDWMRRFCARYGAVLAPHGKTTMSPQLFGAQLANGAWGMTLATAAQVQVAYRFGVRRVLLANQLVAPADIRAMLALMKDDPGFEFYALVDSGEGVQRLSRAAAAAGLERPLPLLVELGLAGKRAGCRSQAEAMAVAQEVARVPGLQLAGIEGYEGLLHSHDRAGSVEAVRAFVAELAALVRQADEQKLFGGDKILLSAGGSAYFDLVAHGFAGMKNLSRPVLPVLRSGCYLTNDHGSYQDLTQDVTEREHASGGLQPALEVWSMVTSRPEPTLAILSMGKRDASYDMELPIALYTHRPAQELSAEPATLPTALPTDLPPGCRIEKMNDQHAYLRLPEGDALCQELKVGDLIGCGISHPCTTFDKWPLLLVVDDAYTVRYAVNTFF